ncbi:hypothetical protein BJ878DRAFT_475949 [Calycina marina]|uniref:Uncharacterized protein n=1 Tax=Calycina marina TaxID=1763456 RepID=A0A9P8CJ12_9HELO|nr:hypothetical protein BJ878DRAFT_475949 [Calycina marina]
MHLASTLLLVHRSLSQRTPRIQIRHPRPLLLRNLPRIIFPLRRLSKAPRHTPQTAQRQPCATARQNYSTPAPSSNRHPVAVRRLAREEENHLHILLGSRLRIEAALHAVDHGELVGRRPHPPREFDVVELEALLVVGGLFGEADEELMEDVIGGSADDSLLSVAVGSTA